MEKLVYGGDALGRVEGRVVLAPFALPGERVLVRPEQEKPSLIRGVTLEVLEPAPERVPAPCPYFGRCGGCDYQHAPYEYQLAAKRSILAEEVRRLGKFDPPEEIAVVSGEPWAYRNRVQLHFENSRMGYHEARSHKLCPIDHCPISSPRLNEAIRSMAAMTRDGRWPRFLRSLELFTDESRVQLNVLESDRPLARRFFEWCGENIPGLVDGALDYEERFRVSPSAFFQVNRFLSGRVVESALEGAVGDCALDLYAGVGLFSLALARRFKETVAVESGPAAARDLAFNAERAGLSNLRTEAKNAEAYLYALDRAPDFIVMDPPRAGLGKTVVARLIDLRPARLVLVACDPSTMARDVGTLVRAGYAIDRMTLVDLFPQTYHFETVVSMSRTA